MPDWQQILGELTAAQLVLWVGGIGLAIGGLVKAWPWIRRLVRTVDALSTLPEWQTRVEEKIDGIHHETHHNDGSSLKDSGARTEEAVTKLTRKLDDHIALCIGLEQARTKEPS